MVTITRAGVSSAGYSISGDKAAAASRRVCAAVVGREYADVQAALRAANTASGESHMAPAWVAIEGDDGREEVYSS